MKILVNIDVPELAPAIEFYCAAFGLSLSRTLDDDVAELTGRSAVIYLLQNAEESGPGRRIAALASTSALTCPAMRCCSGA